MARLKIDYGIDLGTTNSAIARMESGKPHIIKSETLKDTVPSCVFLNKKQNEIVGDKAYAQLSRDRQLALKDADFKSNVFIEFKRTMGTDAKYFSANMNRNYSSEEFSAIVIKRLNSLVNNEFLNAIVITVPAKFTINQTDATVRAAKIAGFRQVELLQEPVAASFAYGLDSAKKEGIWLVFDFGGGTFDAALLRAEDGIMKVFDTEGDNSLGGKNIDYAIIDELLIPYFEKNFSIKKFIADSNKHAVLRDAWKSKAEEAKIQLSFKEGADIFTDVGEDFGEDDNGVPFELDLSLTEADLERIEAPLFQRAIDLTGELLKRNNLEGSDLDTVILVGGPTYSPVLRRMVKEQISERIDFSVDPMTVVARGAALYASTIPVSEEMLDETRDRTKIQLEVKHEPMTVEDEEFVTVKILRDKMDDSIPDSVLVEMARSDKGWTSERMVIGEKGEMVTVKLEPGKVNVFKIHLYDDKGNRLPGEPESISIIQGAVVSGAPLSYSFGIAILERGSDRNICKTIEGLEKNAAQPAKGISKKFRTQKRLRAGNSEDVVKIPLYELEAQADGSRAIYNNHVYDFVITGEDVSREIPSFSEIELTFNVSGEKISCTAYFPQLDVTLPLRTPEETVRREMDTSLEYVQSEYRRASYEVERLQLDDFYAESEAVEKILAELREIEGQLERSGFETDTRNSALDRLRKNFREIDKQMARTEWPNLEDELLRRLSALESVNEQSGDPRSTRQLIEFQKQADRIIEKKDLALGRELLENINSLFFTLTWYEQSTNLFQSWNNDFDGIEWKDRVEAWNRLTAGLELLKQNPEYDQLRPILVDLLDLLPESELEKVDKSLLLE